MLVSTRTRYGTRAMLELGLNHGAGPVSVRQISQRQEISDKYLEQLVQRLKEAGLVTSIRGAGGGYLLARPPADIRMSDIVQALEGRIADMPCLGDPAACHRSATCASRDVWSHLEGQIALVLDSITVADLVANHRDKQERLAASYAI